MVKDSRFILQTGCPVIVCVTGGNSVYRGATAVTLSNFDDKIINSRLNSGIFPWGHWENVFYC